MADPRWCWSRCPSSLCTQLALPEASSIGTVVKDVQESQAMMQGACLCGASQSPELLPPSVWRTEELTLKNTTLFLLGERLVSPRRILAPHRGRCQCLKSCTSGTLFQVSEKCRAPQALDVHSRWLRNGFRGIIMSQKGLSKQGVKRHQLFPPVPTLCWQPAAMSPQGMVSRCILLAQE